MSMQSPYQILAAMERSFVERSAALPSQQERVESWSGIGFRIGQYKYVAPMNEVAEVLHEPRYTLLPGLKNWVKGMANVRGILLPIIDLSDFLGEAEPASRKDKRVLVVEHQEVFAGLVVDAVLGMQHFSLDSFNEQAEDDSGLRNFVHGYFEREQLWPVFSPHSLAKDAGFMDVVA